jgi:hypothetical protein
MRVNRPLYAGALLLIFTIGAPLSVAADIRIDTQLLVTESAEADGLREDLAAARAGLRSDLSAGLYDNFDIRLRTSTGGQIRVSALEFRSWSDGLQEQVLDRLMEYYSERYVPVYQAWVDADANPLGENPFFRHAGVAVSSLTGEVPAERLLADYARQWAYKMSTHNGPNCWHTAVASTNRHWLRHRYMNHQEFSCHLRLSYRQITPTVDGLEFGDVISLVDAGGLPVHAFVYLGPDSSDSSRHIVFTKNGYMRSGFLFQDYKTVVDYIYPGNLVRYYRYARSAVDPSDSERGDCDNEYALDFTESLRVRVDPVIVAGLGATDPLLLAPVRLP